MRQGQRHDALAAAVLAVVIRVRLVRSRALDFLFPVCVPALFGGAFLARLLQDVFGPFLDQTSLWDKIFILIYKGKLIRHWDNEREVDVVHICMRVKIFLNNCISSYTFMTSTSLRRSNRLCLLIV